MTISNQRPEWTHLIRFESNGQVHYGQAIVATGESINDLFNSGKLEAKVISVGTSVFSADSRVTSEVVQVENLLSPLTEEDVPIVRCIGLNYMKHIQEGGRKPPPYPSVFIKPSSTVAGWNEPVPIPKLAQDEQTDYEGELTIVIGRTGKNIPKSQALEYVAGYCSSNDVSARKWQRDPAFAGVVPQWCFSKGFDKYAPLGPVIVSPKIAGSANNLHLKTYVNGKLRQSSNTSDLLFGVEDIVAFASQGTTLKEGSLIMTGTPAGVIMGMSDSDPQKRWLADGDVVRVEIEGLGYVENVMSFE